jgi:NADPH:quinone reductase-like Zn-dependent oxidoreductase
MYMFYYTAGVVVVKSKAVGLAPVDLWLVSWRPTRRAMIKGRFLK